MINFQDIKCSLGRLADHPIGLSPGATGHRRSVGRSCNPVSTPDLRPEAAKQGAGLVHPTRAALLQAIRKISIPGV